LVFFLILLALFIIIIITLTNRTARRLALRMKFERAWCLISISLLHVGGRWDGTG